MVICNDFSAEGCTVLFYEVKFLCAQDMGSSRIFEWAGPCIEWAGDNGQNVAPYPLKSWQIGRGAWPCAPPPWNRPWSGLETNSFTYWTLCYVFVLWSSLNHAFSFAEIQALGQIMSRRN